MIRLLVAIGLATIGYAIVAVGSSRVEAGGGGTTATWGDVNCSSTVDSVDSLWILRYSAGLPQPQGEGACPFWGIGVTVGVDGTLRTWGDNDCSGAVNSVDALKTLRYVASLPVQQNEPCPDIGTTVQVVAQ
jgi:hypothetical protein